MYSLDLHGEGTHFGLATARPRRILTVSPFEGPPGRTTQPTWPHESFIYRCLYAHLCELRSVGCRVTLPTPCAHPRLHADPG